MKFSPSVVFFLFPSSYKSDLVLTTLIFSVGYLIHGWLFVSYWQQSHIGTVIIDLIVFFFKIYLWCMQMQLFLICASIWRSCFNYLFPIKRLIFKEIRELNFLMHHCASILAGYVSGVRVITSFCGFFPSLKI